MMEEKEEFADRVKDGEQVPFELDGSHIPDEAMNEEETKLVERITEKLHAKGEVPNKGSSTASVQLGDCTERPDMADVDHKSPTTVETGQLRCDYDPKEKAMRYLEESGVLRMFQDLAAGIVHDRPEKPFQYMIEMLERVKEDEKRSIVHEASEDH